MAERILVTGATGKTGSALVRRLRASGVGVRCATRNPAAPEDVGFGWHDGASHEAALDGVDGVYLVAPTDTTDTLASMKPFLTRAVASRRRLVLLSASAIPEGGPMMGHVHAWLADHAQAWMVLRPCWFMQNFVTQHRDSIRRDRAVYSATADGRLPFIDAEDIAACAAAALTGAAFAEGAGVVLTGPEALSYEAAASRISQVVGREIRHVRLSVAELSRRFETMGLQPDYAGLLAAMEGRIAEGAEDRTTPEVERMTGRRPNDLVTYLDQHRAALQP